MIEANRRLENPVPVHLGEPVADPAPVAGCDVCAALTEQRARARAVGDRSTATDCNVEMRRHAHPKAVR